jgi:hypothetical protein
MKNVSTYYNNKLPSKRRKKEFYIREKEHYDFSVKLNKKLQSLNKERATIRTWFKKHHMSFFEFGGCDADVITSDWREFKFKKGADALLFKITWAKL